MSRDAVIVIGGGPAGLAAAIESAKSGCQTILIEREMHLGGILNQCIHNGFGLHYFGQELTGPEYAKRFIALLQETNVQVMTGTFVTKIDRKRQCVHVIHRNGSQVLSYSALILAMGCREKTAGQICLPGTRPSGIYTAGQAQKMTNFYGVLPGKQVVILGSGDIGLIMARRLTYEGAHVITVAEIMPQSGGLQRNITQCLEDYAIPLELSTTVTRVVGENRVEGVYLAKVNASLQPIMETERFVPCDALILSVGLIPEIELAGDLERLSKTRSARVNEYRQTSDPHVFACGNVLHVHDLVDNVTQESQIAGRSAAAFVQGKLNYTNPITVRTGDGIAYCVPQTAYLGTGTFSLLFRTSARFEKKWIVVKNADGSEIMKRFMLAVNAGEMQNFEIDKSKITGDITVQVEG